MPFVLVESLTVMRELSPSPEDDRSQVNHVQPDLLDEFPARRIFRRLSGIDSAARGIPVGTPGRVRIVQKEQAPKLVKEQHAGHGTVHSRSLLHVPPDRSSAFRLGPVAR